VISRHSLQDGVLADDDVSDSEDDVEYPVTTPLPSKPPVPLYRRGLGAQVVQRMTGAMRYASERALECPVAGRHPRPSRFLRGYHY
jgi:hypothetical protein